MSHKNILEKLNHLNSDGKAIKVIKSSLTENTNWLNYPLVAQIGFTYIKVYHQGPFSGLLLFNIYVNDMQQSVMENCNFKLKCR